MSDDAGTCDTCQEECRECGCAASSILDGPDGTGLYPWVDYTLESFSQKYMRRLNEDDHA